VLQTVDPAATDQIGQLLERLERRIPSEDLTVTSHGDFHRSELIRRDHELAVLDVDEACLAAPARDLATYAAHAATHDEGEAGAVLAALLEGYGARPEGLSWYLSASLLRRAERPFRSLEEDWPARVEELVDAADRALGD
jgi:aminoglycoside phosphotransferase (APT) family kinase protein